MTKTLQERATEIAACPWSYASEDVRAVIEDQQAEMARLREALQFYADDNRFGLPSEGPWGLASTDFGKRAREELAQGLQPPKGE